MAFGRFPPTTGSQDGEALRAAIQHQIYHRQVGNERRISLGVLGVLVCLDLDADPRLGEPADIHVRRARLAGEVHPAARGAAEVYQAPGRILLRLER